MKKDMTFTVTADDLPEPGEIIERVAGRYLVLIENTSPPGTDDTDVEAETGGVTEPATEASDLPPNGTVVKYVPVETVQRSSVVRHAAAVVQRDVRTRVGAYTLCDQSRTREVARRLDHEPLTNVTCTQCRRHLTAEGLLD